MTDSNSVPSRLAAFAEAQEWTQFHTPKNLAMALAEEVGELLAELQWIGDPEIAARLEKNPIWRGKVVDECADVPLYLISLTNACGTDLFQAVHEKVDRNETRYLFEPGRDNAPKYTELRPQADLQAAEA